MEIVKSGVNLFCACFAGNMEIFIFFIQTAVLRLRDTVSGSHSQSQRGSTRLLMSNTEAVPLAACPTEAHPSNQSERGRNFCLINAFAFWISAC